MINKKKKCVPGRKNPGRISCIKILFFVYRSGMDGKKAALRESAGL